MQQCYPLKMCYADYPVPSSLFLVLYRAQHPHASSIIFAEPQHHDCKPQPLPIAISDHNYCLRLHAGTALLDNLVSQTGEKLVLHLLLRRKWAAASGLPRGKVVLCIHHFIYSFIIIVIVYLGIFPWTVNIPTRKFCLFFPDFPPHPTSGRGRGKCAAGGFICWLRSAGAKLWHLACLVSGFQHYLANRGMYWRNKFCLLADDAFCLQVFIQTCSSPFWEGRYTWVVHFTNQPVKHGKHPPWCSKWIPG